MGMQHESGTATGRGFAATDANGFLAKLYTWITKPLSAGGPGWYILVDKSGTASNKEVTAVDTVNDQLTIPNHGFLNGERIKFTTTGTLPGGLFSSVVYWVHRIDENTIEVNDYDFYYYGYGGIANENITSTGSGTHYAKRDQSYIVICNEAKPDVMGGIHTQIWQIGYVSFVSNYVYLKAWLSPGTDQYALPYQIVGGYWLNTSATAFTYDFRGGEEFLLLQSYVSGSWRRAGSSNVTRLPALNEDPTNIWGISTTSTFSYTPGSGSWVLDLQSAAQANSFTVGKWYFLIFVGVNESGGRRGTISHGTIDAIGTSGGLNANQIRFDYISGGSAINAIYKGTMITPYRHYWATIGNDSPVSAAKAQDCMNAYSENIRMCMPYTSYNSTNLYRVANFNYLENHAEFRCSINDWAILFGQDDNGYWRLQRPLICERWNAYYSAQESTDMNGIYGELTNFAIVDAGAVSEMSGTITVDGNDYISIGSLADISDHATDTSFDMMVLNTEST